MLDDFSVTAVITTFNRAPIVSDAIESVLRQTRPPSELVVVDDGSTDETRKAVMDAFSRATIPCRYIHKANGGMATSLNRGIDEARRRWVAFLDDDDLWTPDHIERAVSVLSARQSLGCLMALRMEEGREQTPPRALLAVYERVSASDARLLFRRRHPLDAPFFTTAVGTAVIRKDFAEAVRFDPEVGARLDIHFFWRLAERTDIALDLNVHGIARQYRVSYISTDRGAPRERKEEIALRRSIDEIRMLRRVLDAIPSARTTRFRQALADALIGRAYVLRATGNYRDAIRFLVHECRGYIPFGKLAKEILFSTLRIRARLAG